MKPIVKFLKQIRQFSKKVNAINNNVFIYRLVDIEEDGDGNHIAAIQIIGKGIVFKTKPEELLADDKVINNFSQNDIRALTYLGYLNTNNPKYKIIATHHSKKLNKMVFAITKKGEKKPLVKTADQIAIDESILNSLTQKDAHRVGYVTATEQALQETEQKNQIKKEVLIEKIKATTKLNTQDAI